MKKNLLFIVPMLIVAVLLFMLRTTGIKVHIALSVVGLVLLIAYTLLTRKEWKKPVLEIILRVSYAIALITGGVLMNIHVNEILSNIHKVSAVLFVILLVGVEVHKSIKK